MSAETEPSSETGIEYEIGQRVSWSYPTPGSDKRRLVVAKITDLDDKQSIAQVAIVDPGHTLWDEGDMLWVNNSRFN